MTVKNVGVITRLKQELTATFEMVGMGPISFYFSLKVTRDRKKKTFKFSQPAYIDKIFTKFYFNSTKILNMSMNKTSLPPNKGKKAIVAEKECYHGMIRFIIFSMVETRPNIAYATLVMSHFIKNPSHLPSKAVKTIFCYLKAIKDLEIIYKRE